MHPGCNSVCPQVKLKVQLQLPLLFMAERESWYRQP